MENFLKRCGAHPIGEFEGWKKSKNKERELVYFAVKKEHDMNFRYGYGRYSESKCQKVLTYDELVMQAIESGENEFEYHNHTFLVKENEDGGYDVISEAERVAEVLIDENEKVVVIQENKREYIRNTRSVYYENLYKDELEKIRRRDDPEI